MVKSHLSFSILVVLCSVFIESLQTIAIYNNLKYIRHKSIVSKPILFDTLLDNVEEETVKINYIPIVNTKSLKISTTNPFGPLCKSIKAARDELLTILLQNNEDAIYDTNYLHGRIEYLIKVLESSFIPIQTIPFLNLAIEGIWKHKYTNVLTPHKDNDEILSYSIKQEIIIGDLQDGKISNQIQWVFNEPDSDSSYKKSFGELNIISNYKLNSKAGLQIETVEHILLPEELPNNVENLILSLQRSSPFQFFDPQNAIITHTYIDPNIRISKLNGGKFFDVYDIFVR